MPPRRKTKSSVICRNCWPDGWPGDDVAATCEHGTWSRDLADTTDEAAEPAGDSDGE